MSKVCRQLHQLFSQQPRWNFPFERNQIPKNGIYILFEKGEMGHGTDRIVRIGTHTGNNQLPPRLEQHFVNENKDRSIFRKNIGRALLNRSGDLFLEQWEWDMVTRDARAKYGTLLDRTKLGATEKQVTAYMQKNFSFCVWRADSKEDRLHWESKIISTVSRCEDCKPSAHWLGTCSPKEKIRESGLWLVNELYKEPMTEREFDKLAAIVVTGGI